MSDFTDNAAEKSWRAMGQGAALIILLTVLVYLPALKGTFLWDDTTLITENPIIKARDGLWRIWFAMETADYYPMTNSLYWLEWHQWGNNPLGYHVVNILLHAINAVLVWLVLRRLRIPGAWWAGLIFAVHPVNVPTAAWIIEEKNTLSMLLFLVAVLLYLKFDERNRWGWYGLSLVAGLLALLSKTAVVMLPVVLLECMWWRHGRCRRKDLLCSVPLFVMSAVLGLVAIHFNQHHRLTLKLVDLQVSAAGHLAVAGSVPWFYLSKALLPISLTVIYPKWQITDSHWSSYVLGVVLVGLFSLFWRKRNSWGRPLLFGFGYYVTMLFPVLGFFYQSFYRYGSVADHWQYYSIVAPIAVVVAFAGWIGRKLDEQGHDWGKAVGVGVLLLLAGSTWLRAGVYANDETLWRDNVNKNPDAFVAHHNLGYALIQSGKLKEAVEQFNETLRLNPDFAKAHYNLGNAMAQLGQFPEAIGYFESAIKLGFDDADVHNNLGNALAITGRLPEAVEQYRYVLRREPDSAEAHFGLGLAFEQMGQTQGAIEEFELVLKLEPNMADARNELARLRAGQRPTS